MDKLSYASDSSTSAWNTYLQLVACERILLARKDRGIYPG